MVLSMVVMKTKDKRKFRWRLMDVLLNLPKLVTWRVNNSKYFKQLRKHRTGSQIQSSRLWKRIRSSADQRLVR